MILLIYIEAENSPVMQNENAGGANVVLGEPTDVLLKRPLKLEMLRSDVSIKQVIAAMHSIVHKSLNVAQPQGKESSLATNFSFLFSGLQVNLQRFC